MIIPFHLDVDEKKREIVCRFPRIKSRERKSHGENIISQSQSNNFLVLELLPKSFLDPNPSVRRKKPVARSPSEHTIFLAIKK